MILLSTSLPLHPTSLFVWICWYSWNLCFHEKGKSTFESGSPRQCREWEFLFPLCPQEWIWVLLEYQPASLQETERNSEGETEEALMKGLFPEVWAEMRKSTRHTDVNRDSSTKSRPEGTKGRKDLGILPGMPGEQGHKSRSWSLEGLRAMLAVWWQGRKGAENQCLILTPPSGPTLLLLTPSGQIQPGKPKAPCIRACFLVLRAVQGREEQQMEQHIGLEKDQEQTGMFIQRLKRF